MTEEEQTMVEIIILFITVSPIEDDTEPIVTTEVGVIRGVKAKDGDYDMFMGIPFGKVLEDNPFGVAQPYPKFEDIFEANDDSAASPQKEEFGGTIIGTLDSLHLNIYVPKSKKPLAVMVWIFGGRYEIGFPGRFLYGPKYFMKQEVILVTINYRLGPYGFLNINTPEVPGNQGFRDVLLALKWIKSNISYFGGNVDNITVFGESSGATAIDLYLTLQETYFHKAILMSGTAIRPLTVREYDKTIPIRLAETLGFKTDNPVKSVEYLAKVHPHELIKASIEQKILYRPSIEEKFDGIEQLIPEYPMNVPLKNLQNIPIMIGFCNEETMFRYHHKTPEQFKKLDNFEKYLKTTFDFDDPDSLVDIVRRFYIGDEKMSKKLLKEIVNFDSDFSFVHPIQRRIQDLLANDAKAVYHYMFKYSGDRNFVKKRCKIITDGACHADEIGYLFDISYESTPSKEDQVVIDRLTTMWSNFAKFGDPTPSTSSLLPVTWSPVTKTNFPCMVIDKDLSVINRPLNDRMAFWDLFFKMYGHKLRGYQTNDA